MRNFFDVCSSEGHTTVLQDINQIFAIRKQKEDSSFYRAIQIMMYFFYSSDVVIDLKNISDTIISSDE